MPQINSAEDNGIPDRNPQTYLLPQSNSNISVHECDSSIKIKKVPKGNLTSPLSPRRRRALERESMIEKVRHMVSSPFPYMVLILLVIMIVMIFVDVMPIAGESYNSRSLVHVMSAYHTTSYLSYHHTVTYIAALTCISAIVMVVSLVIGNHWRGQHIWGEVDEAVKAGHPVGNTTGATKNPLSDVGDEEHGLDAETLSSSVEEKGACKKGYSIIKGQRDIQHRRSLTMNDARRSKTTFGSKEESETLVGKVGVESPDINSNEILLPMTREEKIDNINEFFEDLFKSIDYSILLIFMGKILKACYRQW